MDELIGRARTLLGQPGPPAAGGEEAAIESFLRGPVHDALLALATRHQTPFYVFDRPALTSAITAFQEAFSREIPGVQIFYAMKANPHPELLRAVLANGFGLDVSSGKELRLAVELGAAAFVFTGPGKTVDDLRLAAAHADRVIVHLDSERELERAVAAARAVGRPLRLGVRVTAAHGGEWSRFGIPLDRLPALWRQAARYPEVQLQGIQFHTSWNETAEPYCQALESIAGCLRNGFTPDQCRQVRFVDVGGGFWPQGRDGVYPWATPAGELRSLLGDRPAPTGHATVLSPSVSEYAARIRKVIDHRLRPLLPECRYFVEPGRIICNDAMHVLLRVVEVKRPGEAVLDGGYNILGWEKLRNTHAPLVNLTRPSSREIPFAMYGSLCQADDVWGYFCYAERIEEGDVIAVPFQGAYTYALRHDFIRSVPTVYGLPLPEAAVDPADTGHWQGS